MSDNKSTITVKKSRIVSTVFKNKSGCEVTDGVMKLIGTRDGYKFQLTSVVSSDPTINNMVKISIEFTDKYLRASKFNFGEKMLNKIHVKFAKYANLEVISDNDSRQYVSFKYPAVEFITSPKVAIKFQKRIGIITKLLNSVNGYIEKMITNKVNRQKALAERKAAKLALEKEAAESLPGAVLAKDSVVSGEVSK